MSTEPAAAPAAPAPTTALLEVSGLDAFYGKARVLDDLSFTMEGGSLAIVGRNGMGKTTLCNAIMGISTPGSDERTNLRGRDRVGGWFIRAGDGFRMYVNDSRDMGASMIAEVTVIRPGIDPLHVEANFRVEGGEIAEQFCEDRREGE